MARMIPPQMDVVGVSTAERRVFRLLESDPGTRDWMVLHSLGLARRESGPYGEIDFVAIVPDHGIICIEVKGGRVTCQDGIWRTVNRHGKRAELKKSPFLQAREGMFALRRSVIRHFGERTAESNCPIGYAVVFPDVACPPLTPEFDRAEVIDYKDLRKPISKSIMRMSRHRLLGFQPRNGERLPTPGVVRSVRDFLRPDFDLLVARRVSIERTEAELLRLTTEQYTILDELEANPRCVFEGAAGTGKTLLAVEHARRAERNGSKVLLVCFNRLLGEWLRQQTVDTDITAGTWHAVARRLIAASSVGEEFQDQEREAFASGDNHSLYHDLYPLYGAAALEETGAPFDVLVVDEVQDLGSPHIFDFLNYALCGGFAGGHWAIFGDFNRQALYGGAIHPVSILSEYNEHYVKAKLTVNCRNSRRIAEETTVMAGFEKPPFRLAAKLGLPVEHRYWRSATDLICSLAKVLERFVRDQIPAEHVILLCPQRLENSTLAGVSRLSRFQLVDVSRDMTNAGPNAIRFSTVHSFKGLESEVVIVLDIDSMDEGESQSILYVAMSRARSLLILMINEHARKAVESRIRTSVGRELSRV